MTEPLSARAFAVHRAGDLPRAEGLYRQALAAEPDDFNSLQLLGTLLLGTGRVGEAVVLLERAVALLEGRNGPSAPHAALFNNLGNALLAAGRAAEAVAAYGRGVDLDPGVAALHANLTVVLLAQTDPAAAAGTFAALVRLAAAAEAERLCALAAGIAPGVASDWMPGAAHHRLAVACLPAELAETAAGTFARVAAMVLTEADAHCALGRLHTQRHEAAAAEAEYRAALALQPDHANALARLALTLIDAARTPEAVEACGRLLALQPGHAVGLCTLGAAHAQLGNTAAAVDAYVRCVTQNPDFPTAHFELGVLFSRQGLFADAAACLERATALQPDFAPALAELGNVMVWLDQPDRARANFLAAQALQPLATWPAAGGQAEFAVLVLLAPVVGNTPIEYLLGKAPYDAHFLRLLSGSVPDPDLLRRHGDVVVNMISDVDRGGATLPEAALLVDRLGKPVVNHPARILATDRAGIARALTGIPHCRVPRTERFTGADLLSPAGAARLAAFPRPLLLRLAGSHGGDEFDRVAGAVELAAIVARRPSADFYVSEYVDTRSDDGYFRKYRLFFVDGEVLPYHLAIASDWKVHHFRTDMERHPWMQQEEEAFLRDPGRVFDARRMAALRAIQAAVGLEFCGIDCALDRAGDVVVFEANATMLVHGDNRALPYKDPAVARVKRAFDAMLGRMARGGAGGAIHPPSTSALRDTAS